MGKISYNLILILIVVHCRRSIEQCTNNGGIFNTVLSLDNSVLQLPDKKYSISTISPIVIQVRKDFDERINH